MAPILLERALSVKAKEFVAALTSAARVRRFTGAPGSSQQLS
jgi:hypothetical protein